MLIPYLNAWAGRRAEVSNALTFFDEGVVCGYGLAKVLRDFAVVGVERHDGKETNQSRRRRVVCECVAMSVRSMVNDILERLHVHVKPTSDNTDSRQ